MLQIALFLLSLPSAAPQASRELEDLFHAARADTAQVVVLLERGSRELGSLSGAEAHALALRLEPFARRAFFGPERLAGMERLGLALHTVAKGELPGSIAKKLRTDAGLFELLNEGYDPRRVQIGARLKVLDLSDGSLGLVVDRERHHLALWRRAPRTREPILMAYVPVGLGAPQTPTPLGRTRVSQRVRDPEWTEPVTRKVYPPKDPGNVLGGFWIALDESGIGRSGIGLHGYTGAPPADWLGKPGSNGCVRMLQADIERVFYLALADTQVEILASGMRPSR